MKRQDVCNHCYLHLNSCLKAVRQNTSAVNFDSLHVQLLTVCNVQIAISASYLQQARNPQCERAKELEVHKPDTYLKNI